MCGQVRPAPPCFQERVPFELESCGSQADPCMAPRHVTLLHKPSSFSSLHSLQRLTAYHSQKVFGSPTWILPS